MLVEVAPPPCCGVARSSWNTNDGSPIRVGRATGLKPASPNDAAPEASPSPPVVAPAPAPALAVSPSSRGPGPADGKPSTEYSSEASTTWPCWLRLAVAVAAGGGGTADVATGIEGCVSGRGGVRGCSMPAGWERCIASKVWNHVRCVRAHRHVHDGESNAPVAVSAARSSAAALKHVIPQPAQPIHSTHTHTHTHTRAGLSSRVDTTPRGCHPGPHTSRRLSDCWRSCCMCLRASAPCWACWASLASSCAAPSASRLAAWAAS